MKTIIAILFLAGCGVDDTKPEPLPTCADLGCPNVFCSGQGPEAECRCDPDGPDGPDEPELCEREAP